VAELILTITAPFCALVVVTTGLTVCSPELAHPGQFTPCETAGPTHPHSRTLAKRIPVRLRKFDRISSLRFFDRAPSISIRRIHQSTRNV
jgi:hypothetical protein